jgi:RimJ/RimL family protein N-acetyltransferase
MPPLDPVEITAGEIHLRPWRPADAEDVFAACQDPAIQRWTRVPSPYTRADAEQYVGRHAPEAWRTGSQALFAVVDSTTAGLLASVGLISLTDDGDAEVGYWCAAAARGRGVTPRAVAALTRYAFGALDVRRVGWRADVDNAASRRVAEKAGFTIEGRLRRALVGRDGGRTDCWVGSRLPEDPPPPAPPR